MMYAMGDMLQFIDGSMHGTVEGVEILASGNVCYGLRIDGIEPLQYIAAMILEPYNPDEDVLQDDDDDSDLFCEECGVPLALRGDRLCSMCSEQPHID